MSKPLDHIHHIAITVQDINETLGWYVTNFSCAVDYCDESWALLRFQNIALALVRPDQHPPHFAVTRDDVTPYGQPVLHRDGTRSVYIQDPSGNRIEMLRLADEVLVD